MRNVCGMLSFSTFKGLIACVLGALAACLFVVARAEDALTRLKADYRRPAALRLGASAPSADPIWTLGQTLFKDPNLAGSRKLACASCHQQDVGWSDHLPKARGEGGSPLPFRAPTLVNVVNEDRLGWIGSYATIADVAFAAMGSSANMNMPLDRILSRLAETPYYATEFKALFPEDGLSKQTMGVALTRYVGSIMAGEAPFDRWIEGDAGAIDASAQRGFALFNGKAECSACHGGWSLSDTSFHDIGIATGSDVGRGARFKSSVKLLYAFKTPTLRNVAERAPYMHDGSLASLEAVIDHYDKGGIDRPSRDPAIHPLQLTLEEKTDLVAFLKTLSGPTQFFVNTGDIKN